jgi:hypothetical protein
MGGYDIFRSVKLKDNTWKTPQNIGYPVNTTDDDKFFEPVNNGINAYYSMPTDYKKRDIFYLGIGVPVGDKVFEIEGTLSLNDTVATLDENYKIYISDAESGDTIDIGIPYKDSGHYNFNVNPGKFRITYTGTDFLSRVIDTTLKSNDTLSLITLNVTLDKVPTPVIYEKLNLSEIPAVAAVDSADLIRNMRVNDITDNTVADAEVLYYTVQVMALYNPVDITYFRYVNDMKVMYNDEDKFFRYTTGQFATLQEAVARRTDLINKGYPEDIFVKKISK